MLPFQIHQHPLHPRDSDALFITSIVDETFVIILFPKHFAFANSFIYLCGSYCRYTKKKLASVKRHAGATKILRDLGGPRQGDSSSGDTDRRGERSTGTDEFEQFGQQTGNQVYLSRPPSADVYIHTVTLSSQTRSYRITSLSIHPPDPDIGRVQLKLVIPVRYS